MLHEVRQSEEERRRSSLRLVDRPAADLGDENQDDDEENNVIDVRPT